MLAGPKVLDQIFLSCLTMAADILPLTSSSLRSFLSWFSNSSMITMVESLLYNSLQGFTIADHRLMDSWRVNSSDRRIQNIAPPELYDRQHAAFDLRSTWHLLHCTTLVLWKKASFILLQSSPKSYTM